MALFNYATKEITLKIVYYGPGLSGKTTNLLYLHSVLNPSTKGKLLSLSTESDRTLFFDFLPIELGKIRDFSIRFQLYTVPGQVQYNATRKVVLKGADAVVFVADSQKEMRDQNIESFSNMRENLHANNINPDEIPVVLQFNKRDLKNILPIDELNALLNSYHYAVTEAAAVSGQGVEETFKLVTRLLLKYISNKHKIEIQPAPSKEEPRKEIMATPEGDHESAIPEKVPVDLPEPDTTPLAETTEDQLVAAHADASNFIPKHTSAKDAAPLVQEEEQGLPVIGVPSTEMPISQAFSTAPVAPDAASSPDRSSAMIREAVSELASRINVLAENIAALHNRMKNIEQAFRNQAEDQKSGHEKELNAIGQSQTKIINGMKDLSGRLDRLKEKKTWFKF